MTTEQKKYLVYIIDNLLKQQIDNNDKQEHIQHTLDTLSELLKGYEKCPVCGGKKCVAVCETTPL